MSEASFDGYQGGPPAEVLQRIQGLEAATASLGDRDGTISAELIRLRRQYGLFDQPTSDMSDW